MTVPVLSDPENRYDIPKGCQIWSVSECDEDGEVHKNRLYWTRNQAMDFAAELAQAMSKLPHADKMQVHVDAEQVYGDKP